MVQHYFVTAWVPPQGKTRNYEMTELQKNLLQFVVSNPLVQLLQAVNLLFQPNYGLDLKIRKILKKLHLVWTWLLIMVY